MNQKELRERLHYNPETGKFVWIETDRPGFVGKEAGSISPKGYLRIKINGAFYQAQNLAWLYMKGAWPVNQIDHENLVRNDNRWINLREANNSEQQANGSLQSNNTSGHKGVYWHSKAGKWMASVKVEGKQKYLGLFLSREEAAAAYAKAAKEAFGEFARPI